MPMLFSQIFVSAFRSTSTYIVDGFKAYSHGLKATKIFWLESPFNLAPCRFVLQGLHGISKNTCVRCRHCYCRGVMLTSPVKITLFQIAGMLYYSNKLAVQKFLRVPGWAARCGSVILEPVFSDSEPTAEAPLGMGATLDIQRQQRMDMLDQQLLLSQLEHLRRNAQQQQAQVLLQYFYSELPGWLPYSILVICPDF